MANPNSIIASSQYGRLLNNAKCLGQKYPRAKYLSLGLFAFSGLSIFGAAQEKRAAEEVIAYQKQQLDKTTYVLQGGEKVNFPWNKDTYKQWDHRVVQITGRPRHGFAYLVPAESMGLPGYQYIVPVVTHEKDDATEQSGVLINLGFIPHSVKYVPNRDRVEDVSPQTFTCYVSKFEKYTDHSPFQGNCPEHARNRWTHANLEEMSQASGFLNQDSMKVAALEQVRLDTPNDEHHWRLWDISSDYKQDYPYVQTRAGALQNKTMPWHCNTASDRYTAFAAITGALTGLLWLA